MGQTGQTRSGHKKVEEEDGGGPPQVLRRECRKRSIQSCAESRKDNKRGRERPNTKRRRSEEEEGDVEKKRQGSSSYDSSPSPSTSSCSRTHNTGRTSLKACLIVRRQSVAQLISQNEHSVVTRHKQWSSPLVKSMNALQSITKYRCNQRHPSYVFAYNALSLDYKLALRGQ